MQSDASSVAKLLQPEISEHLPHLFLLNQTLCSLKLHPLNELITRCLLSCQFTRYSTYIANCPSLLPTIILCVQSLVMIRSSLPSYLSNQYYCHSSSSPSPHFLLQPEAASIPPFTSIVLPLVPQLDIVAWASCRHPLTCPDPSDDA